MTDIKRHLPEIFKLVKRQLQAAETSGEKLEPAQRARILELVVRLLPASYGIGSGWVVNKQGQLSAEIALLIYDKTIPLDYAPENGYLVQQLLAAIEFEVCHDLPSLAKTLAKLASVKELKSVASEKIPPSGKPGSLPKQIFPLGLLFFNSLQAEFASFEDLAVTLDATLKKYPAAHRPDYLYAFNHQISYRNPLIDGLPLTGYDAGFCREPELVKPRNCYVCKAQFFRRHFYYDWLCRSCGDLNYYKRQQTTDLSGKFALVTGGRVKIGYAVALKLLRAGATVIVTSRFPHDTAKRYSQEMDFSDWAGRLHIYGLDFRHLPSLEAFTSFLNQAYPRLDILINNAAQTVRRPPAYYAHLLAFEELAPAQLPSEIQPLVSPRLVEENLLERSELTRPLVWPSSATLSQIPLVAGDEQHDLALFPSDQLDRHGQQLDLRPQNSWLMKLEELSVAEIVEVQTVNAIAPGVLLSQLKDLMQRGSGDGKFIINVSAVEGQFTPGKRPYHPHTNMAKAALNMLTHSCAPDYAEAGIYINSVDPGWISEQDPLSNPEEHITREEQLPIDELDAAARICDPIFSGLKTRQFDFGKLFKDYRQTSW